MELRRLRESDIHSIVALFYDTVHKVNIRDYTREQVDAWASREDAEQRTEAWKEAMSKQIAYVAVIEDEIVGFADMSESGYLDRLFVHSGYQRRGIASALADILESEAGKAGIGEMVTDASITARPFFEQRGYEVVTSQSVARKGVTLTNFKMRKTLPING
jgi:putative acetyltransferase